MKDRDMSNEEALYAIFSAIEMGDKIDAGRDPYYSVFVCAEKALEKQIAKKPTVLINDKDVKVGCVTFRKGVKTYKCTCGCWVTLSQNYCSQCGQKLDLELIR